MKVFLAALLSVTLVYPTQAMAREASDDRVNADGKYSPQRHEQTVSDVRRSLSLKKTGDKQYRIGMVEVDLEKREVSFPITIEKTDDNLEYALVSNKGKIHESLLITDCLPAQIHYGVMLLGVKRDAPVEVLVSWKTHGPAKVMPLEQLIKTELPKEQKRALSHWYYSGEVHVNGFLNAQGEQSIIALINDPNALVNRSGSKAIGRDDIYLLENPYLLPKKGFPMRMVFKFEQAK